MWNTTRLSRASSPVPTSLSGVPLLILSACFISLPAIASRSNSSASFNKQKSDFTARLAIKDQVRFLKKMPHGLRVLFTQHAAYYTLDRANPDYAKIEERLRQSMNQKEWIRLEIDAQSLRILSVDSH